MEIEGLPGSWVRATYTPVPRSIYGEPTDEDKMQVMFYVTMPNGEKRAVGFTFATPTEPGNNE